MAYDQKELDELISCPKMLSEPPRRDLRLVGADWRNDMKLVSEGQPGEFSAFFRRSDEFPENFSVGLIYDPKDGSGEITLLRCNGQHGVFNGTFDPRHPHWGYHVHRATEQALNAGLKAEKYASTTTEYASYEQAVQYFLKLINLDSTEARKHFPDRTAQAVLPLETRGD